MMANLRHRIERLNSFNIEGRYLVLACCHAFTEVRGGTFETATEA
jgi:hypothetical protein